jgi:hypothetical protein
MGIFFSRVYNYFYSTDKIVYSRELCISLPVTQNDIYKENNIKNDIKSNKQKKSYYKHEIIEI